MHPIRFEKNDSISGAALSLQREAVSAAAPSPGGGAEVNLPVVSGASRTALAQSDVTQAATRSLEECVAGVLVPVFALRGQTDLGIGDTTALKEFVDWAAGQGFRLVKMLPINESGGDHSPYNAISSRALDPSTLHTTPDALPDLKPEDYAAALKTVDPAILSAGTVRYDVVIPLKTRLLKAAFATFEHDHAQHNSARHEEFLKFVEEEKEWIDNYTLFRALMAESGTECWDRWPEKHRSPGSARQWLSSLAPAERESFERRRRFFAYVQWIAFTQWRDVKAHATRRGVSLMGDIPFGVSYYSVDVWAHPELFKQGCGGTPPDKVFKHDAFVQKWGQNWGIPLYDWDAMRADNFHWWRQRVRGIREFFDLFRIDHILGFYRIYGFPWRPDRNGDFLPLSREEARKQTGGPLPCFCPRPDDTPEHKRQNCREGEEYLRAIIEEAGAGSVIGEDLGEVPDYVRPSLTKLGIAGYKIPAWEMRPDGSLIPGKDYQRLSLVTYGTHDHPPLRAVWEQLAADTAKPGGFNARREMRALADFAGFRSKTLPQTFTPELHEAFLEALFGSNSYLAVVMITDLFARTERFNFPGVAMGANWSQRLHVPVHELDQESILPKLREILRKTGRAAVAPVG
ncbi:4-alpha-glucanotransferase [Verrucomicrobiota bacterium sgz303538]